MNARYLWARTRSDLKINPSSRLACRRFAAYTSSPSSSALTPKSSASSPLFEPNTEHPDRVSEASTIHEASRVSGVALAAESVSDADLRAGAKVDRLDVRRKSCIPQLYPMFARLKRYRLQRRTH